MTLQIKDRLTYKDNKYFINTNPFDPYIQEHNIKFSAWISCCWRGYSADWMIEDNKLFLTYLHGWVKDENKKRTGIGMCDIFPNQYKVFAEWFSGEIDVPFGEIIGTNFILGDILEKEMFLKSESGVLVSSREINNRERLNELLGD